MVGPCPWPFSFLLLFCYVSGFPPQLSIVRPGEVFSQERACQWLRASPAFRLSEVTAQGQTVSGFCAR